MRSAARLTLSAGFVIRVATSRALTAYSGERIRRRSDTRVSRVVAEKRRDAPTFNFFSCAPQNG